MIENIQHASAIFVGNYTAEAIGDYVAGPNHTLPTGGTARFSSPLSVLDFIKSNHIVELSREGFLKLADAAEKLAEAEQLFAHANSIKIRKDKVFYK
ncbi:MAG: histidinol dehydrogenase, partial [Candidatus Sumerlaeia bacterium]|nr:histidinol dehydrogenase [Candidatus Sumerlaeia bacterium]